jgi:hypothetical protein
LSKLKKKLSLSALVLVLILVAAAGLASVNAQGTATVTVNTAPGGTTDVTGTKTYNAGDTVTITAVPSDNFALVNWIVSSTDGTGETQPADNPLTFTAAGGATYTVTPVFVLPQPIPGQPLPLNMRTAAIVIIYPSSGGVTTPAPGTYALADASNFTLYAIPNQDWQFAYWTICGANVSHGTSPVNWTPTDNPYTVDHGYGETYRYQAVFTPINSGSPNPSPSIPELSAIVLVAMLLAVIPVVLVARKRRH